MICLLLMIAERFVGYNAPNYKNLEAVKRRADQLWTYAELFGKTVHELHGMRLDKTHVNPLLHCFAALDVEYPEFSEKFSSALQKFLSSHLQGISESDFNMKSSDEYSVQKFDSVTREIKKRINQEEPMKMYAKLAAFELDERKIREQGAILARLKELKGLIEKETKLFLQMLLTLELYKKVKDAMVADEDPLDFDKVNNYFRPAKDMYPGGWKMYSWGMVEAVSHWRRSHSTNQ